MNRRDSMDPVVIGILVYLGIAVAMSFYLVYRAGTEITKVETPLDQADQMFQVITLIALSVFWPLTWFVLLYVMLFRMASKHKKKN